MKRLLFMIMPVIMLMLAFRPVSSRVVEGKITDERGNAIPGALIHIRDSNIGTLSSSNGSYSIVVGTGIKTHLSISAIGFKQASVAVKDRPVIHVTLKPDVKDLN